MTSEKMYSIAIRKRKDTNDFFWNHDDYLFEELKIDCKNRYWLADPFLFEKNGLVYVFYEAFDLIRRKGEIGYSIIDGSGKKLPIHIILDEPYHLSFPYLFEYGGDILMMPESCGDNSIKLFKAISFPDKWEEHEVILHDIFACDTIIAQDKHNIKYLLASVMYRDETPNGNYISCWVKNIRFKLNQELKVDGDGLLVAEGDRGIRNAGKTFMHEGKLFRVGQNCPNKLYGKGLVLFEVESLEPYKEKLLWIKDCEDFDNHIQKMEKYGIIGVHTYNFSDSFEIIDFSQIRDWKWATILLKKRKDLSCRIFGFGMRIINKLRKLFAF